MTPKDKSQRKAHVTRGRSRFSYRLEVAERRAHVFRLAVKGASTTQIAQTMHTDPGWKDRLPRVYRDTEVWRDIVTEAQRRDREMAIDVETVRRQQLELLDSLQLAIIQQAHGTPANLQAGIPAQPPDLAAQQQVLRIIEKKMKLIPGLSAPLPIAPVSPDGTQEYQGNGGPTPEFFNELAMLFQVHGAEHGMLPIDETDNDDPNPEEE